MRNEGRIVQRLSHPQHEVVAREVFGDSYAAEEGNCLEGDRCGVQFNDQLIEDGLQVRVGRIAGAVSRAPLKEDVKGPSGCLWYAREGIHLWGDDRIEDHTAQVCRIQAHDGERQSRAVGNTFRFTC